MEHRRTISASSTSPLRHLHVLCLALSFFISVSSLALAQPRDPVLERRCPSTCKNLQVEYPFGAKPGCGSPGFQLDCNAAGEHPAWVLPRGVRSQKYVVVDITENYYFSGSFVVRDAAMSNCTNALPADNLALQQLNLSSFTFANLSIPPSVDVLVFNCSGSQEPPSNARIDKFSYNSSVCNAFLRNCQQNLQGKARTCFSTHSIDADFRLLMNAYNCSTFTSFYEVPSPVPSSFPSAFNTGVQLRWSELLKQAACDKCMRTNGTCGYVMNDVKSFLCLCSGGKSYSTTCSPGCSGIHCRSKRELAIALPVVAFGAIIAATISCVMWRRKRHRMAEKENNPIILRSNFNKVLMQVFAEQAGPLPTKLFTYRELHDATRSFSNGSMVGDGGFGTVYEGILYDRRKVAVKRLYHDNCRRLQQFFNEIRILSSLEHPNLIKLYGFCYEDDRDLLLVYEFISNRTLADHLHGDGGTGLLWETRLNIAVETAQALAYLHSSVNPPVFHRDVKSSNILLDENFHVKLADFGLSRLVTLAATHVSTAPQGTPGYLDPDYHQCYQLTDKSDVYSFGVVLMEIISSKPAVDMSRDRKEINLSCLAASKIQCGSLDELVDPHLEFLSNPTISEMITRVAALGLQCLALEKDDRPSMKEVADNLEKIRQFGYCVNNDQMKVDSIMSSDSDEKIKIFKPKILSSPTSVHTELSSSTMSSPDRVSACETELEN